MRRGSGSDACPTRDVGLYRLGADRAFVGDGDTAATMGGAVKPIALAVAFERSARRNLVRHFIEMVLAMLAGMAVFGAAAMAICAAVGHAGFFSHHAGLRATLMAFNMTLGMALWMRHRGHSWNAIRDMGAAMFVPLGLLVGPFLAGTLSGGALLGLMHVLMLPAMAVAMMLRREEYTVHHPVRS
jgi:hypothetical protein